jgi:hypothetical protein
LKESAALLIDLACCFDRPETKGITLIVEALKGSSWDKYGKIGKISENSPHTFRNHGKIMGKS